MVNSCLWPQPISCLVQGGKSEIFITMHIHFLNTNESFYLNTNDHSEGRKENIFLLMNFSRRKEVRLAQTALMLAHLDKLAWNGKNFDLLNIYVFMK